MGYFSRSPIVRSEYFIQKHDTNWNRIAGIELQEPHSLYTNTLAYSESSGLLVHV